MNINRIRFALQSCFLVLALAIIAGAQRQELKLEILNGHSGGGVLAVAVSSDGKFALTGSTDRTALLWDLETGKQLRRFVGHEDAVSAVQFSKDGQFVLTASYDKTARLWETATGKQVRVFVENRNGVRIGHSGKILTAAISADGLFVATASGEKAEIIGADDSITENCEDKTARIWNARTGNQLFLIEQTGCVNSIAFSPDSKLLLMGGEDKIARLYSTETGKEIKKFIGHNESITSVAYSPDGKQVLTGSSDKTVRLWNIELTSEIKKFNTEHDSKVSFLPNGSSIIVDDGNTRIIDILSGNELGKTIGSQVNIAMTPNGKQLLISDFSTARETGEEIGIFDIAKNTNVNSLKYLSSRVNKLDVSFNSQWLLTGANYDTSSLWDLTTGKPTQHSGNIEAVAFVPQNNLFAELKSFTKTIGYEVNIFDAVNSKLLQQIQNENQFEAVDASAIAFSPDGNFILIGDNEGKVRLWKVEKNVSEDKLIISKQPFRELPSPGNYNLVSSVAFSPDGNMIASASAGKNGYWSNVEISDTPEVYLSYFNSENTGQIIQDFLAPVWSVAFSPDGKTMAAAGGGGEIVSEFKNNEDVSAARKASSVRFFDVETGKEKPFERIDGFEKEYINKIHGFKSVAYSPDGKYLAAGSFNGKVYLRNNETGALWQLEGHTDTVNSVKFAKDANGQLLVVSGSSDSTTRIWNALTGEEICALITFRDGNWAVVQTRTGRYDAPNGGEIDGIQWVYGTETIALNQLKDIYYTPNLLPRLLGYNLDPLRPVPELSKLKLFPKILEQKLDEATAKLTVKLQNRGGGIGEVLIKVNGKLAAPDARRQQQKADWNAPEMTIDFNLQGSAGFDPKAKNKIEIVTNNYDPATKKGYISSKGTDIVYLGNASDEIVKPTFYAVVAGVSDYVGDRIDLNFAAKDAEDFARALGIGARRLFCPPENQICTDKVKIKLLTTNQKDKTNFPTKEHIKAAFAEIAREAGPEDVLVVYLSGHGASLTVNDTDTYFYLAQDADKASKEALQNPEYRKAAAISSSELLDWLTQTEWRPGKKGIDANKQVMILDTCAAGAFEGRLTAANKTKDLSADQIRALERLKDRSGFQILMGSAANQSSYEASQYGQGLLTYALLEGIKGAALQNQTRVETATLFDYAVNRVPKMDIAGGSAGLQQPRVFGATSIPIGLILTQADKDAIKLESVKPVLLRPRFSTGATGDDDLDLIGALRKKFEEAGEAKPRGDNGETGRTAQIVYVDDDNFPGAYRVTGTYETDADGQITITPFLRKDNKTIVNLPKVSGKDANEAAEKLLDAILKAIPA